MRALVFKGRAEIGMEQVDDPALLDSTDVIVGVKKTAICGSDLHVYHERERGIDHGTVMGHEFTGEIVACGKDVQHFRIGDHVYCPFTTNCGSCYYCRTGLTSRCGAGQLFGWVEGGIGLQGAQAEYVRVPLADATLVKRPEDIDFEEGLLMGDILATGTFCAERADIPAGGSCLVIGCGPVGIMAIVAARELGIDSIYALDLVPERLVFAASFGATALPANRDSAQIILDETSGRGVDGVLEVVGSESATKTAINLVRPGGTISMVGVHTATHFALSPTQAYDKNITLRIGRCPARYYMPRLTELIRSKRYPLTSVFTHRMSLEDGPKAYQIFDHKADQCMKVLFSP